jgi:GWxTD domain-containing protein
MIFVVIAFPGCSIVPKSFKETTLDDMYPILTDEQYQEMKTLNSDEELTNFLDTYWHNLDSTSCTSENEYKTEYVRRLKYANEHFPDSRGWGRSDRKRIYLVYGPPDYIERYASTENRIGAFSRMKSIEIWLYMSPGKNNSFPSQGNNFDKGEKKFLFADVTGVGIYKILYSSEDNGDIDIRMFNP